MTLEVVDEQKQEPEVKTMTWRVLQRDPDTIESVMRWLELEPLTGEGQFGYYPDATEVGEKYGEGDYILISGDGSFGTTNLFSVVADKVYRRASKGDGES